MIETSVAPDGGDIEERGIPSDERENGRDALVDVPASFPLEERIKMIECIAERMGV